VVDPRPAGPADLPAIREVVTAAYARYLGRMDRPPAPMLADYGAAVEAGRLWVTGEPVTGLIELTEAGDNLHVGNVAVHPASQGTGLGRQLMDFAERRAITLGLTRLSLYTNEVMTENQAIYTHLGYREVDRHTEDGYRRVYMEKLL
jgi:GNAT superfamily N-acetyltransferase